MRSRGPRHEREGPAVPLMILLDISCEIEDIRWHQKWHLERGLASYVWEY